MPSPKTTQRRPGPEEKNRKGKKVLQERSSSFHGRSPAAMEGTSTAKQLPRPRTVPELLATRSFVQSAPSLEEKPRLTKLLLNVTVQGSLGPLHVIMTPESKVGDLVAASLKQYAKEGRRPILPKADPSGFDLHYSQFSLQSLERGEELMTLGSRNFFLCAKRSSSSSKEEEEGVRVGESVGASSASCAKQAEKASKNGINWLKFMDFLL